MTGLESKMLKLIDYGQVSVKYHGMLWIVTSCNQFEGTGKNLEDAVDSCLYIIDRRW